MQFVSKVRERSRCLTRALSFNARMCIVNCSRKRKSFRIFAVYAHLK